MNRTDTLESGHNRDIRLGSISRAESTRSSVIERKQNFFRRVKSFVQSMLNESLDETGWVTSTIKLYIANCNRDDDHDWANYVEEELNTFRKLKLKTQYKLGINVLAHPLAHDSATQPSQLPSLASRNRS